MTTFYKKDILSMDNSLSEDESKHCALVLRHQIGDRIRIFDGNGGIYDAVLTHINKKKCDFDIIQSKKTPSRAFTIHLAISPTKNVDRMEWLIEKLSEIGVNQISFIETKNSERKKLRMDRLEKKAISAMKQSGNPFLPKLNPITNFNSFITSCKETIKLIAHVDQSHGYISDAIQPNKDVLILIGPEGDFTLEELELANGAGFIPISLGTNTLRTETAGFVACCSVKIINKC